MSAQALSPSDQNQQSYRPRLARRQSMSTIWKWVFFSSTAIALLLLVVLLGSILRNGWGWLSWNLITKTPSRFNPREGGMNPAVWGSLWIVLGSGIVSFLIGVGAAIYLEEYAQRGRVTDFINTNIANLAGVPSIVYGLLGVVVFVDWMNMGRSILAGALAMALLILPVVVVSSREAIRAVPPSLREASYGLGATRWQTVQHHVLPAAMPGIMTGVILSMSRAIGETAPLLAISGASLVRFAPASIFSDFIVMPLQIYNWSADFTEELQRLSAAAIIVLLIVLLLMNSLAIAIRQYFSKKTRW